MALIYCPECGNSVSEKATSCPHCGCPLITEPQKATFRLEREKKAFFCAVKYEVYLDYQYWGILKNGDSLIATLALGAHHLKLVDKNNFNKVVYDNDFLMNGALTFTFSAAMNVNMRASSVQQRSFTPTPNYGAQNFSGPQNYVAPKQKKKSKWWLWLILAFFAVGIISTLSNGGESSNNASTSAPKETAKPTPTPYVPEKLSIGDTFTYDGLEFTVNSVVFSNRVGNLPNAQTADSDYCYCVVYIDVNNTTNETKTIISPFLTNYTSDYSFVLLYDGAEYRASFGQYTEFLFGNETILPYASLTNKIINFRVPIVVQNSDKPLEMSFSYKSTEQCVWTLR